MIVNLSRYFSPAPAGCRKRFEKTRSRMVYHAILGDWGTPQQATDGSYWPSGHCLPIIKHDIGKHCLLIIRNDIRKPRLRQVSTYFEAKLKTCSEADMWKLI